MNYCMCECMNKCLYECMNSCLNECIPGRRDRVTNAIFLIEQIGASIQLQSCVKIKCKKPVMYSVSST